MGVSIDFLKRTKGESTATSFTKNIAAGGLAGASVLSIMYPLDYVRVHLINDLKSPKGHGTGQYMFSGSTNVCKQTLAANGVRGLYRGFGIALAGIFMYRGLYFGLYDTTTPLMRGKSGKKPPVLASFAVAYATTTLAGFVAYPLSTIQHRMVVNMSMTPGDKSGVYSSSFDCASKIMKAEGFFAFFKGAGVTILKGVAGAAFLVGYDEVKKVYVKHNYGDDAYV